MTRRCIIEGCTSKSGNPQHRGVTFHSFPFDTKTRDVWLHNCRIDPEKNITKSVLVCSRHFRRADFQPVKSSKYLLRQGSVPTIFPWGKVTLPETSETQPIALENEMEVPASGEIDSVVASVSEISTTDKIPVKRASEDSSIFQADPKMPRLTSPPPAQSSQDIQTLVPMTAIPTTISLNARKTDTVSGFVPGVRLEAQDFEGNWHSARIVEVDNDEREVLIRFEKNGKAKGLSGAEEWIPMNSSRLRQKAPVVSKSPNIFVLGEKCLARWTGSRRFPATVHKVLENDTYEVLFDDGYMKVLKSTHISKLKVSVAKSHPAPAAAAVAAFIPQIAQKPTASSTPDKPKQKSQAPKKDWPLISISSLNLLELNLPEIPTDGEWCCHWVNDQPIGREGFLTVGEHKKPTVIVDDWRLPPGWTKHMYQRSNVLGKWDVILVNTSGKRFRSKADLKQFIEDLGQHYNPDIYDFSIHRRRAKDIGAYVFTNDYKPPQPAVKPPPTALEPLSPLPLPTTTGQQDSSQAAAIESILQSAAAANLEVASSIKVDEEVGTQLEDGFVYVGSLKVQIIDNLFRCPKKGCNKNFRKENHLQIHVKHYHEDIAKFLGECPNMQELACKRTVGHPPDEPLPKNYLPNSQYFAKLHQQDLQHRLSRKSTSTPMTPTISTPTHPGSAESFSVADEGKLLDMSDIAATSNIFGDSLSTVDTSSFIHPTGDESTVPLVEEPKPQPVVPPPQPVVPSPQPRSQPKYSRKSATERKSSRQRLQKKYPSSTRSRLPEPSFHLTDFEETRHSFNEAPEQKVTKKAKLSHPTFVQDANLDGNTTGSIPEQTIIGQSPKYIQENGEFIKIVRMRSEEIINCLCSFGEEDGLMIQCELCLCWQHGICNGIERESQVPEKYVCYICKNPTLGRASMKYVHDQDWLYDGKLPIGNYHSQNPKLTDRFNLLRTSHTLSGNLIELKRFLHSLRVKINIAQNKDHPKMYLWAKKWESSLPQLIEPKVEKIEVEERKDETDIKKEDELEDGIKVEVAADDMKESSTLKQEAAVKPKHEVSFTQPNIPQPEAAIDPVECQHRLLEHIQKQQSLVMERLQYIESDISELESLDPCHEFDTNDTRTNQTIALLIRDLENMQNIAKINATPPPTYTTYA